MPEASGSPRVPALPMTALSLVALVLLAGAVALARRPVAAAAAPGRPVAGASPLPRSIVAAALLGGCAAVPAADRAGELRGTGDLGLVVERASGRVLIVETSTPRALGHVEGLGDLSHASAVYSRDARYAYLFGRDGGLSKIDLLRRHVEHRVVQAGNSIGGAISQDGSLVAVSNYDPGGVRIFDAHTLAPVADIPAVSGGHRSRVVGLVDAPGRRFVFALYDAGEIWVVDVAPGGRAELRKFPALGRLPYDALITPDGRHYIAGLFGDDGFALLDLWHPERGVRRIRPGYGHREPPLPVYKMPHLEGWALAGEQVFLPAPGRHELLVLDRRNWNERARVPMPGQPVFAVARPDGREVWVNFALPDNDRVEVIDTETAATSRSLRPGKAVLHMEFTPRGEQVWISVHDEDRVDVYDTRSYEKLAEIAAERPSGIFLSARAHRIGL